MLLLSVFFGVGGGLGVLYFGGLWLSLRRMVDARRPKALVVGGFLIRTIAVFGGFYGMIHLLGAHWQGLSLSLLGFLAARFVLVRRWGLSTQEDVHNA